MRVAAAFLVFAIWMPSIAPGQNKAKTDHPLKDVKVGDYAKYRQIMTIGTSKFELAVKLVVSAKDEQTVTLKMVLDNPAFPKNVKTQIGEVKFDLTKPFDPTVLPIVAGGKTLPKKTGEGKEMVKIGEKSYDCEWISYGAEIPSKGRAEVKVWLNNSIPLARVGKVEQKLTIGENMTQVIQLEFTGSGSEK